MSVGEDDGLDIVHGPAQLGYGVRQLLVLVGIPRIDDSQLPTGFNDEPIHHLRAQPIDPIRNLVCHGALRNQPYARLVAKRLRLYCVESPQGQSVAQLAEGQ